MGHRGGMGGFSHKGGLRFDSLVHSVDQAVGIWVRDDRQGGACPAVNIRLEGWLVGTIYGCPRVALGAAHQNPFGGNLEVVLGWL